MNDPQLDAPIAETADAADREKDDLEEDKEEERAFLNPSLWWFASIAFPLVAGTFGPIASAFNVCAIVEPWRVSIQPGGVEEHSPTVPDPGWLVALNSLSLAFAIVANIALLFNMARRLSFQVAQPITIIGWYISGFLLVGLVAATSYDLPLPPGQNRALNSAFYYAIMAAGLYIIIASLMVVTVYGAYMEKYPKKFELTNSQRTLMLQTIAFMIYLLGGAAVYARIEQWTFVDSVYFADYTLLTIGIGDYHPETHLGRSLLFPYAIGGIVILGLVIGSIRSLVLERGKRKLGARMIEKERQRMVKKVEKKKGSSVLIPVKDGHETTPDGKTETERREEEFNMMRLVQERASKRRNWTSLLISVTAWFSLWLIGALVFMKAEYGQQWTYFGSLYFSYTSLTTIGYGDFYPQSNSGKPFFVFWSLLAVPAITILVSNMGDTVIEGIKELTIWLGELTVLPGEKSTKERLKKSAAKVTNGKLPPGVDQVREDPTVLMGETDYDDPSIQKGHKGHGGGARLDKMARGIENNELDAEEEDENKGDFIGRDIHHYHYLLAKEIRKVMKDVSEVPPKRYTYGEWCWFLRLMGEDENSTERHRKATTKMGGDPNNPELQEAGTDLSNDGGAQEWSWMGTRSPLMGETEEADWILERLSITLERELKKQRDDQRRASPNEEEPTIKSTKKEKKEDNTLPMSRGSSQTLGDDQHEQNEKT